MRFVNAFVYCFLFNKQNDDNGDVFISVRARFPKLYVNDDLSFHQLKALETAGPYGAEPAPIAPRYYEPSETARPRPHGR